MDNKKKQCFTRRSPQIGMVRTKKNTLIDRYLSVFVDQETPHCVMETRESADEERVAISETIRRKLQTL